MFGENGEYKLTGNYFEDKQLLIELYEIKYGIFDHYHASNPLDSVMFRSCERSGGDMLYKSYLDTFIHLELSSVMSFEEYIANPRFKMILINEVAKKRQDAKTSASEDARKELDELKKKLASPI